MMGRFIVSEIYKINSFIICILIWASCTKPEAEPLIDVLQ